MNKLPKVNDKVTLAVDRPAYGNFKFVTGYSKLYIKSGAQGICGATKVPSVTGKNGRARYFACIDFPWDTPVFEESGIEVKYENKHKNSFRVAVYPEEIK